MIREWFVLVVRIMLVLLFAYTGGSKLLAIAPLENAIRSLPLIGPGAWVLARLLVATELVMALLLLFERTVRAALWLSLALVALFIIYLCYMLFFVPHLPCSCGGVIGQLGWKQHLMLNLGLTAAIIAALRQKRHAPSFST